jgi:hypothetical protein
LFEHLNSSAPLPVRKGFDEKRHPRWPKGTPGIGGQWKPEGLTGKAEQLASRVLDQLQGEHGSHGDLAKKFNSDAKKVDWKKLSNVESEAKVRNLIEKDIVKPLHGMGGGNLSRAERDKQQVAAREHGQASSRAIPGGRGNTAPSAEVTSQGHARAHDRVTAVLDEGKQTLPRDISGRPRQPYGERSRHDGGYAAAERDSAEHDRQVGALARGEAVLPNQNTPTPHHPDREILEWIDPHELTAGDAVVHAEEPDGPALHIDEVAPDGSWILSDSESGDVWQEPHIENFVAVDPEKEWPGSPYSDQPR